MDADYGWGGAAHLQEEPDETEFEVLEKEADDATLKFGLQDLGSELIREIVKRSPIYSDLAQEI